MKNLHLFVSCRHGLRIGLFALLCMFVSTPLQAQPDLDANFLKVSSNWTNIVFDCVTGDNPSGIPGSPNGKEPDATGGTGNLVCDDWEANRYERPLTSSAQEYSAWQDLVEARAHKSSDWWYFWIEVFGSNQGVMQGFFLIEMDTGLFAGGTDCSDWILWNNNPTSNIVGDAGYDTWSEKGMDSFSDGGVSGSNNVGGQSPTCNRADFLDGFDSSGGDGYDVQGPKEGDGDIYGMVPSGEDDSVVILAVRKSALTYPGPMPESIDWRAWTNEQSHSPNYYDPNDEYNRHSTNDQVGDPYQVSPFFPVKGNIKELDNTPMANIEEIVSLPVELIDFTAVVDEDDIELTWITSSERNNLGFELEHSIFGVDFESIGSIEGAGTTEEENIYKFRIENAEFGRQSFRLKQLDFDGSHSYSDEVEITNDLPRGFLVKDAFPNPFNPRTNFSILVDSDQHIDISVYNLTGQRVASIYSGMLTGQEWHQMTFESAGLSSGSYLIRSVGRGFVDTQSVVLMK